LAATVPTQKATVTFTRLIISLQSFSKAIEADQLTAPQYQAQQANSNRLLKRTRLRGPQSISTSKAAAFHPWIAFDPEKAPSNPSLRSTLSENSPAQPPGVVIKIKDLYLFFHIQEFQISAT
jgi:hypothetical protein